MIASNQNVIVQEHSEGSPENVTALQTGKQFKANNLEEMQKQENDPHGKNYGEILPIHILNNRDL